MANWFIKNIHKIILLPQRKNYKKMRSFGIERFLRGIKKFFYIFLFLSIIDFFFILQYNKPLNSKGGLFLNEKDFSAKQ